MRDIGDQPSTITKSQEIQKKACDNDATSRGKIKGEYDLYSDFESKDYDLLYKET